MEVLLYFFSKLHCFFSKLHCGDVESNPGPSNSIKKIISGSFHQGDQRFGYTAGMQFQTSQLGTIAHRESLIIIVFRIPLF